MSHQRPTAAQERSTKVLQQFGFSIIQRYGMLNPPTALNDVDDIVLIKWWGKQGDYYVQDENGYTGASHSTAYIDEDGTVTSADNQTGITAEAYIELLTDKWSGIAIMPPKPVTQILAPLCTYCEEHIGTEDTEEDGLVCKECSEDYYCTCGDCGRVLRINDSRDTNEHDELLCVECAEKRETKAAAMEAMEEGE